MSSVSAMAPEEESHGCVCHQCFLVLFFYHCRELHTHLCGVTLEYFLKAFYGFQVLRPTNVVSGSLRQPPIVAVDGCLSDFHRFLGEGSLQQPMEPTPQEAPSALS